MTKFAAAYGDESVHIASAACLVLIIWRGNPQLEHVEEISALQRKMVAEHGYCVSLSIVQDKLSVESGEGVKEASAQNMKEFAEANLGAAVVVEQGGLRATIVRSVITGIKLLAFSPIKQQVFRSTSDALEWLAAVPGLRSKDAQLLRELNPELQSVLRSVSP